MRLRDDEPNAINLLTTPLHLGLGSRARPIEGFAWDPGILHETDLIPSDKLDEFFTKNLA